MYIGIEFALQSTDRSKTNHSHLLAGSTALTTGSVSAVFRVWGAFGDDGCADHVSNQTFEQLKPEICCSLYLIYYLHAPNYSESSLFGR